MTIFQDELWTFPCDLNVKAMGLSDAPLPEIITEIAQKYCSAVYENTLAIKESKTGKYHSITLTVRLESKEHAKQLYTALGEHDQIKWTL